MTLNREIRCDPGRVVEDVEDFVCSFDRDAPGERAPEGGQQVQA